MHGIMNLKIILLLLANYVPGSHSRR